MPEWVFIVVQIAFWMALSTWFGAVLFVVLAPPIILRTVRQNNPVLPAVMSVNLEGQHGTLLAGSIIGELMTPLIRIELVCSAVILVALIGQWIILAPQGMQLMLPIFRTALYIAASVFLIYDWRVVWPRMWRYRQEYLDHADEPEVANPALDLFDKYQSESLTILRNILCLLIGIILFSAFVTYSRPITIPLPR
jgi:hypothetical protein